MQRREFLTSSSLLAISAASQAAIDTHTHFYDPERPQGVPWPPRSETLLYRPTLPAHFARTTAGLDVAGAIVIEASPWLEDNQWVLDLAREHPLILGFVGNLNVRDTAFLKHLERFAANPLFRGIRISGKALAASLDVPGGTATFEHLAAKDLSLDVVGDASLVTSVSVLAERVASLRIIVDHLPFDQTGAHPDHSALHELRPHHNVFAKVSNVPRVTDGRLHEDLSFYRGALDKVSSAFGPDRLLYGSNWPVSTRVAPYAVALRLGREYFGGQGPLAAEKFFFRNSAAAYKWTRR